MRRFILCFLTLAQLLSVTVHAAGPEEIEFAPLRGELTIDDPDLRARSNEDADLNNWDTQSTDLYEILKISPSADLSAIKARFRQLVKLYHPNSPSKREPYLPAYTRYVIQVQNAWDILSDPQLRAEYDIARGYGRGTEFADNPRAFRDREQAESRSYADLPFEQMVDKRGSYLEVLNIFIPYMNLFMARNLEGLIVGKLKIFKLYAHSRLLWFFAATGGVGLLTENAVPVGILSAAGAAAGFGLWYNQYVAYSHQAIVAFDGYIRVLAPYEGNLIGVKKSMIAFDLIEPVLKQNLMAFTGGSSEPNFGKNWYKILRLVARRLPYVYSGWMFRYLQGELAGREWLPSFENDLRVHRGFWRKHTLVLLGELYKHGHLTPAILGRAGEIFGEDLANLFPLAENSCENILNTAREQTLLRH